MSSTKDDNPTSPPSTTKTIIPTFTNPTDDWIYRLLLENGPMTRDELKQATGIARSTLYDALLRMILRNLIFKLKKRTNDGPGRPKVYFTIDKSPAGVPAPMQTFV